MADVQADVIDQAHSIPIFEEPQVFATTPTVEGFCFDAVARPSFYRVWKANANG